MALTAPRELYCAGACRDSTKRGVTRAGANLRGGGGVQSDPEFNEQEIRLRNLERRALRLLQETKGYRTSIADMASSQHGLAENLSAFLMDVQRSQDHQAAYCQAAASISQEAQPQFNEIYTRTVMQPMAQYCGYLPEFDRAIKKRKQLSDDLEKARRMLAKEQSKTPEDPAGVARAEQDVQYAEEAYASLNRTLIAEIPKLINARVYVTDPSFEAFVKTQLQFFSDSLQQMNRVAQRLPPAGGADDDHVLDERINSVMSQIRSLDICTLNV
ncbi:BAR adaptor protein Hob3 [Coemansia nantahalensis]|uniref:BAR adaptor protein Hob3 n=1 Tax=Coemansia nantahalensis TaxID=2789366 RepID=A0ACC1K495_9FUNG|nr:BAR adaptor protein Hob3 [Coemansia nantahalensis]